MECIEGDIYDYPKYYDLVFGSDWQAEFRFLEGVFAKHATGKVKRVFEPACGTGRLLYRMAEAGYEVSGLDLNPKAVEFCNARLKRKGYDPSVFIGDMTDFKLRRKSDASFNTINSFRHLLSDAAAAAHLRCVAEAIRKGGLYVLGLHLSPTQGEPSDEESWSARRGHLCVNTHMATTYRNYKKRLERFAMSFHVHTPTRSFKLQDELSFRTYTASEFSRLIADSPGWEVAEVYDFAYDLEEPIQVGPKTEDVVYVLRRR